MDPPATPPFNSSISAPGLLTSKERMMMRRGAAVKSLGGTGICEMRLPTTASTLTLSWAEIGIIGAFSATVPRMNLTMLS